MPNQPEVDPDALREARIRAGLTQHQLARLIGVAGGERVSRWELGTSAPRPSTIAKLAEALNVNAMDLLKPLDSPADLRLLRLLAGYGSRETAQKAHLASATYIRWEAGSFKKMPSDGTLKPLARVLSVDLDTLRAALEESQR